MGRIMEQANGLITRGAEGAGDAEDPSRTIASERVLNGAIVAADISQSFEEYVEIFDHFYAEDIEGTTDAAEESVHGKAAVPTRLAGFLVPLHVFAEIGGESVSIQSSPIREDRPDEAYLTWPLQLRGLTGTTCTVTWSSRRRWLRGASYRNITMTTDGSASHLRLGTLRFSPDGIAKAQWAVTDQLF
jgi:hypothetical protein